MSKVRVYCSCHDGDANFNGDCHYSQYYDNCEHCWSLDKKKNEDWKKVFREFYDDNEAGGSSRWLVAPNIIETFIENLIKE